MKKCLIFMSAYLNIFILTAQGSKELSRFKAPNATQAIAVDEYCFYTISNSKIIKRDKESGKVLAQWEGPLKHLNSGIIIDGKLYCANTNYPETPMASSIEIFDTKTLEHVGNHSFGIYVGSCTWLDRKDDTWYVMFVHYDERGKERDLDASYTTLIQFDNQWRRMAGWTVSKDLVDHLRPMSISGGTFGKDGLIYASPHHFEEMYVLKLPEIGYELEWLETIEVPFRGQGIAWDPSKEGIMYGIHRKNREVISAEIKLGD